jgi:transformation/transcription domain-associated protein
VPFTVPLAPSLRLVQNDASITALQDVWEQHCRDTGIGKDDPVIAFRERVHDIVSAQRDRTDVAAVKLEAFEEVTLKLFPDDILKKVRALSLSAGSLPTALAQYMLRTMATPSDLWHIRKQMTLQFGAFVFMTNVFCMTNRTPARIHFSRSNGGLHTSDMLPCELARGTSMDLAC